MDLFSVTYRNHPCSSLEYRRRMELFCREFRKGVALAQISTGDAHPCPSAGGQLRERAGSLLHPVLFALRRSTRKASRGAFGSAFLRIPAGMVGPRTSRVCSAIAGDGGTRP